MDPDFKALFADAQTDQAVTALTQNAKAMSAYYCELINGGVPKDVAGTLTLEMLRYFHRTAEASRKHPHAK
jgi:hypothetical protein